MELDRALSQISEIHAQVARSELFRGYRAVPMAMTGGLALLGAGLQSLWFAPVDMQTFVLHWLAVAGACAVVSLIDLWQQETATGLAGLRRRTLPVLAQYLPTLVAGIILTSILWRSEHAALLPGLWAILNALGVFSSRPFLPRAIGWVSLFYLLAGAVMLAAAVPHVVPSPWTMGLSFGVGQLLLAAVLHFNLERSAPNGSLR